MSEFQPASKEIVALFDDGFECWNGGEPDLMPEFYAEDAVVDPSGVFTDVSPIHGREELRHYMVEMWDTWEGVRLDPLEVIDLGRGRFLVDVRFWGKGKRSGAEVDQVFAFLYTFGTEGKILHNQFFPDWEAAIAAAEAAK